MLKNIKMVGALLIALVCGMSASAASQVKLTDINGAAKLSVTPGAVETVVVELTTDFVATQFYGEIALPEGLTLVANEENEYDANGHYIMPNLDRVGGRGWTTLSNVDGDVLKVVVGSATNKEFAANDGALFTFDVVASEDFEGGEITLANGLVSNSEVSENVEASVAVALAGAREPFGWDFTKGGSTEGLEDIWNPELSKGRSALLVDIENQELGFAGLEGIYFTITKGAVYGISNNYCLQHSKLIARIPGCAAGDKITINFCGAGSEAKVVSESLSEELVEPGTKGTDHEAEITADGDLVLTMTCSKGFRLYSINIEPGKGTPTGITNVNAVANVKGAYNIAGQKVNSNAKGFIIVNGKTVNNK